MKGLELARQYYETCGKEILQAQFSDVLPYLAIGLAGSGSECYGFDDGIVKYYPKNDFKMHVNDVRLILQRNKGQKEDVPEEELPFALTS